jgi:hypothetical protein
MMTGLFADLDDVKYILFNLLNVEIQGISHDNSACTNRNEMMISDENQKDDFFA